MGVIRSGGFKFKAEPWLRKKPDAVTTTPLPISIDFPFSRLPGGGTVTITGVRFRLGDDGSQPLVFFGSSQATGVVLNSSTSISCTVPLGLEVGAVDVVVQCGSQSGTLLGGFLYYIGTVQAVTPAFARVASSAVVLIRGNSFIAGASFTFGGVPATGVTFIDDTQYGVTIPNHAAGYVDVVMTEADGGISTLRNGFQYTALARGEDIRRLPSIHIAESLGGQPNTAEFTIDGESNKPYGGEEIHIRDEEDGDRTLFRGCIQTVDQVYEGQTSQLAWLCTAKDFSYLLNKYRPFGSYTNVPANLVVIDVLTKYTIADFQDFSFIQTNLALITISFDGTKTVSECLDMIAQAIGGGRWFLGYDCVVHFFHPPINTDIVLPPSVGSGADFTAAILSVGGTTGSLTPFKAGYYAIRVTFLYSNGAESRLGPASNIVGYDGTAFIHIAGLPIGANPSATITCVGRKIYYLRGNDALASGWTVNDNVTTTLDVTPAIADTATVTNNSGDPVTVQDTGSSGTLSSPPPAPNEGVNPLRTSQVPGSGKRLLVGGSNAGSLTGAPTKAVYVEWNPIYGDYIFAMSAIYSDGTESQLLEQGNNQFIALGDLFISGGWTYPDGVHYSARGYDAWFYGPNVFSNVATLRPIAWKFYYKVFPIPVAAGAGGSGGSTFGSIDIENSFNTQSWKFLATVPYFVYTNSQTDGTPVDPATGAPISTTIPIAGSTDLGAEPKLNPADPTQTLTWPNPDGPYLENTDPPEDIDDTSEKLLHADSGSQPFVSTEDITQLRNRVKVYGAGSTTTADAAVGDSVLQIANTNTFGVTGGTVITSTGVILDFFSVSSPETGASNLLLTAPLQQPIPSGVGVSYFCQVEDKQSQRDRGAIELDKNGNKTDGVHEFVISEPTYNSPQQLYLRAHAEIQVFSKPIVLIKYATLDSKSRPGSIVHVDLTEPPCKGDFLIQSVNIDQVRSEGPQLAPRYTVIATSSLFDLTSFLLTLSTGAAQSPTSNPGSVGVVTSATTQAANNANSSTVPSILSNRRTMWWTKSDGANTSTLTTVGTAAPTITGGSAVFDSDGWWARPTGGACRASAAATFTRFELLPKAVFRIRTPPAVNFLSPVRFLIGLNESLAGVQTDTPALASQAGIYIRYSTSAADPGWVIQTVDRGGRTAVYSGVPIAVSTIYTITITTTSTGGILTVTVDINGVSTTITTNIVTGVSIGPELILTSTSPLFDISSVYVESN